MASERIWAPWRLKYVAGAKDDEDDCIFCTKPREQNDAENLILHRGERSFVIMNLFPYTNGHVMVAPFEHLARIQDLDPATSAEMFALGQRAMSVIDEIYEPQGYNVGFNQGRAAGAGVAHHIHMHIVPRWGGDTNFMPVLGDTRVMNQSLGDSYEALRAGLS